jgi:hypothetical protein
MLRPISQTYDYLYRNLSIKGDFSVLRRKFDTRESARALCSISKLQIGSFLITVENWPWPTHAVGYR